MPFEVDNVPNTDVRLTGGYAPRFWGFFRLGFRLFRQQVYSPTTAANAHR